MQKKIKGYYTSFVKSDITVDLKLYDAAGKETTNSNAPNRVYTVKVKKLINKYSCNNIIVRYTK